jgi:GR25 family glycosyltransferase involved in LPS biosynthesis
MISKLNEYFDKIYCINVGSREDRKEHIENQMLKFGLEIVFFDASVPEDLVLPEDMGDMNKYEYACADSHVRLLEKIAKGRHEKVLILEDDVEFINDLNLRFDGTKIPDYDMLYLGLNYANSTYEKLDETFSRVSYAYTTHAYAVTKKSAKKILKLINRNNLDQLKEPIDVLYAKLMCNEKNDVFVFNNPFAVQKDGHSSILQKDVNYTDLHPNRVTKVDLKDVTFIMPVRYDGFHRIENVRTVLLYLAEHFDTNITVIETGSTKIKDGIECLLLPLNVDYMNIEYDDAFNKMKMVNDAFKSVSTPIFAIYDSDILIPSEQIEKTVDILRKNNAELLLPFDDFTREVSPETRSKIKELRTIDCIDEDECKITNEKFKAPGGACFIRSVAFKFIGRGNEHFISWGPEDQELIERMKLLGGRTGRVD